MPVNFVKGYCSCKEWRCKETHGLAYRIRKSSVPSKFAADRYTGGV